MKVLRWMAVAGGAGGILVVVAIAVLGRSLPADHRAYQDALAETADLVLPSSNPDEIPGLAAFLSFYGSVTETTAREQGPRIYAPDAWFFDTLKVLRGGETIGGYLAETAARASTFTVRFDSVAVDSPDVYVRWTMTYLPTGWESDRALVSQGMSQLRFNADGLVVLHRDFWDAASGFYEHVPGVGHLLRTIRRSAI